MLSLVAEIRRVWSYQALRFLLSGGLNTLLTWGVYVLFLQIMPYRIAYTVAYVLGIVLAYASSRYYVFGRDGGGAGMVWIFIIYALQYLLGLVLVSVWVRLLQAPAIWASPVAAVLSYPLVYLSSSFIFRER